MAARVHFADQETEDDPCVDAMTLREVMRIQRASVIMHADMREDQAKHIQYLRQMVEELRSMLKSAHSDTRKLRMSIIDLETTLAHNHRESASMTRSMIGTEAKCLRQQHEINELTEQLAGYEM